MSSDEELKELYRAKAGEIEQWRRETQVQLDERATKRKRLERRSRFFSRNSAHLWKMSPWVWMPLVAAMVGMLSLALFAVAVS
jgi:type VI protein secretion system component VasF